LVALAPRRRSGLPVFVSQSLAGFVTVSAGDSLFRFGVPGTKGLSASLRENAKINYRIPESARGRVAAETIRDWLKAYRKEVHRSFAVVEAPRSAPAAAATGRRAGAPAGSPRTLAGTANLLRGWPWFPCARNLSSRRRPFARGCARRS
jgi:hypothetical protein